MTRFEITSITAKVLRITAMGCLILLVWGGVMGPAAGQWAKNSSVGGDNLYTRSKAAAGAAGRQSVPNNFILLDTQVQEKAHVVLVDKATQEMLVYACNGQWRLIWRFPCSTGKNQGPKQAAGDKKTPEGIYFSTRHYTQKDLSPIYGTHAFPLDYPNELDQQAGRGGSAIWIHGTNKALQARDSNGCIVLADDDIEQLSQYIRLHKTPVIIVARLAYSDPMDQGYTAQKIRAFLNHWSPATRTLRTDAEIKPVAGARPSESQRWQHIRRNADKAQLAVFLRKKNYLVLKHGPYYLAAMDLMVNSPWGELTFAHQRLFLVERGGNLQLAFIPGDTDQGH